MKPTFDDEENMRKVVKWLRSAIRKQKQAIRQEGHEPTWELFTATLGWHQIKKRFQNEQQFEELYHMLWEDVE